MNSYDAEISKQLRDFVNKAHSLLNEAVKLSNETLVPFEWDLSYGMNGWYHPLLPRITRRQALDLILEGKPMTSHQKEWLEAVISETVTDNESWESSDEAGWLSSSNC